VRRGGEEEGWGVRWVGEGRLRGGRREERRNVGEEGGNKEVRGEVNEAAL
jgi:hypothetical protein